MFPKFSKHSKYRIQSKQYSKSSLKDTMLGIKALFKNNAVNEISESFNNEINRYSRFEKINDVKDNEFLQQNMRKKNLSKSLGSIRC